MRRARFNCLVEIIVRFALLTPIPSRGVAGACAVSYIPGHGETAIQHLLSAFDDAVRSCFEKEHLQLCLFVIGYPDRLFHDASSCGHNNTHHQQDNSAYLSAVSREGHSVIQGRDEVKSSSL